MHKPSQSLRLLFLFLSIFLSAQRTPLAQKATVAILDTGIDFSHFELSPFQFFNAQESLNGIDDDGNGLVDDISGWNFITMEGQGRRDQDYPHFNEDFYRYYEVRRKRSLGIATDEEELWYQEKRKDKEFQETRELFRRAIHGTHVAGLATGLGLKQILKQKTLPRHFESPDILNITYLGDALSGPALEPTFNPLFKGTRSEKLNHLKMHLMSYLEWQKAKLLLAVNYAATNAHVINASFGISYKSAGDMVERWWNQQFSSSTDSAPLEVLQNDFRSGLLAITQEVVDSHPHLVFVFSAGNGNDPTMVETHYPSGVRCNHCLTVGASLGTKERASFSNYGKTSVSLFAPGVATKSSVPTDRFLPVNGTSQAAPQVAYSAANILMNAWDIGLFLNTAAVKEIIMATVDKVENLKDQCTSGGILNPLRAIYLTRLLKHHPWQTALKKSFKDVKKIDFLPPGMPVGASQAKNLSANLQEADELSLP